MDVAIVFSCWVLIFGAIVAKVRSDNNKRASLKPVEELEPPREANWDHIHALEADLGLPLSNPTPDPFEDPPPPKAVVNHGTGQVIAGTRHLRSKQMDMLESAADVAQILQKEVTELHKQTKEQTDQIRKLEDKLGSIKSKTPADIDTVTTENLITELQKRGVMRHSSRTVAKSSAESFQVTKGAHTSLTTVLVTDTFQLGHYELLELGKVVVNYTHNPMLDPRRIQVEMLVLELRSLLKTFQTPNPFGGQSDAETLRDQLKTVEFCLRQIVQYSGVSDAHLHRK